MMNNKKVKYTKLTFLFISALLLGFGLFIVGGMKPESFKSDFAGQISSSYTNTASATRYDPNYCISTGTYISLTYTSGSWYQAIAAVDTNYINFELDNADYSTWLYIYYYSSPGYLGTVHTMSSLYFAAYFDVTSTVGDNEIDAATVRWMTSGGHYYSLTLSSDLPTGNGQSLGTTITDATFLGYLSSGEYINEIDWIFTLHDGFGRSTFKLNHQYITYSYTYASAPGVVSISSTQIGDHSLYMAWAQPADNGDPDMQYQIYRDGSYYTTTTALSFNDTSLALGEQHSYYVTASNDGGEGPASSTVILKTNGPPSAPQNLKAISGSSQITLNWSIPLENGGKTITHYSVFRDGIRYANTTSMTYTDMSLVKGETHIYSVTAVNSLGEGPKTSNLTAHTLCEPFPITDLAFTPQAHQILLTWSAPADNGGFPINRYSVYKDGIYLAYTENISSFTDTGLADGEFHNYTVTSNNSIGESGFSNEVEAHSDGVPNAPVITGITRGIRRIGLTWNTPYDMGDPIYRYNVFFGNGTLAVFFSSVTHSCNVTGLNNNTIYGFYVTAVNNIGESLPSTTNSAKTFNVASAPWISPGIRGINSVAITWTAPSFTDGLPVLGYDILVDTVLNVSVGGSVFAFNMTGLADNETHGYQVRALTAVGTGVLSQVRTITAVDVPGAPANLQTSIGLYNISISWVAPADGGNPIIRYDIYRNNTLFDDVAVGTLVYMDIGLGVGEWHNYTVVAVNGAGTSAPSNEVVQRSATVPGAPLNLDAVSGIGNITLSWSAAISDTVAPVRNYSVYQDGVLLIELGVVFTYRVTGLANNERHNYTVSATNIPGEGSQCSEVLGRAAALPGIPQDFKVNKGVRSLVLVWSAPADIGGIPITNYVIYRDGGFWANAFTATTWTDSSLGNGEAHSYYLRAENALGTGSQSSTLSNTTYILPTAPQSLVLTPGDENITISWALPSFTDGLSVTFYSIFRNGGSTPITTTALLSYVDSGRANGTSYSYSVSATTAVGEGPLCTSESASTFDIPSVPLDFSVVNGTSWVNVSWTDPSSTGGTPILGYRVYRANVLIADISESVLSYADSTATGGVPSMYNVLAYNIVGASTKTASRSGVIYVAPSPPRFLTATAGNGQIQLSWTAPASNGGSALTNYRIYRDGAFLVEVDSLTTSRIDTALGNGAQHVYAVSAVNSADEGLLSGNATATTWNVPGAPVLTSVSSGNKQISLIWTAPATNGGTPITQYRIYRDGAILTTVEPTIYSHIDSGLSDGEFHAYRIDASNIVGNGTLSSSRSAETFHIPTSPTGVQVASGVNQITITWGVPADQGNTPLTVFRVYKDGAFLVEVLAGQITYIDTAINGIETHQYRVAAANMMGEGLPSAPVQATSQDPNPIAQLFSGNNLYYTIAGIAGLIVVIGAVVAVRRKKKVKTASVVHKGKDKKNSSGSYQNNATSERSNTLIFPVSQPIPQPPTTPAQVSPTTNEKTSPVFCDKCKTSFDAKAPIDFGVTTCPTCNGPVSQVILCPFCQSKLFIDKNFFEAYGGKKIACSNCSQRFVLKLD